MKVWREEQRCMGEKEEMKSVEPRPETGVRAGVLASWSGWWGGKGWKRVFAMTGVFS